VTIIVHAPSLDGFDAAFGLVGLKVGSRTGPKKRTSEQKEWYVVRRFLKEAISGQLFACPFVIRHGVPPEEPDFVLKNEGNRTLIEITEATDEADQREMKCIEVSDQLAILNGELGGRFKGGAIGNAYEVAWAEDVINAIERKVSKSIFKDTTAQRHLVIYPNSNASSCDEDVAGTILKEKVDARRQELVEMSNGCLVHVLGKQKLVFDILGSFIICKRCFG
jgi:hypothetical protein